MAKLVLMNYKLQTSQDQLKRYLLSKSTATIVFQVNHEDDSLKFLLVNDAFKETFNVDTSDESIVSEALNSALVQLRR